MKKLIRDFRHLQCERQKAKLVKKKMVDFNILAFQRNGARPDQLLLDEQRNVIVRVHQGVNIVFLNQNGRVFFGLYDTDIVVFDDGEPDSDQEDNKEPTLITTLTIYEGTETVTLEFQTLFEKRSFNTTLSQFLELRLENT